MRLGAAIAHRATPEILAKAGATAQTLLIEKGLLSPHIYGDGSGFELTNNHRLTDLGCSPFYEALAAGYLSKGFEWSYEKEYREFVELSGCKDR